MPHTPPPNPGYPAGQSPAPNNYQPQTGGTYPPLDGNQQPDAYAIPVQPLPTAHYIQPHQMARPHNEPLLTPQVQVHVQPHVVSTALSENPVMHTCRVCHKTDYTRIETSLDTTVAIILVVLALICFCTLCCLCCPFAQVTRHYCRHCNTFVGEFKP